MTRYLDFILSLTLLICLLPLLVVVAVILRLTGEHEIFYKQLRIGENGKELYVLKFATMLKDSPSMQGGYLTQRGDPRVLPFGVFLRKFKINEIPQLLNILKGEMSFVGPRPLAKVHYAMCSEEHKKAYHNTLPGLTSVGSLYFRDEESIMALSDSSYEVFYPDVIIPYKGALEVWYAQHRSVKNYFKVIILTGLSVFFNVRINNYFDGLPEEPGELQSIMTKIGHYSSV